MLGPDKSARTIPLGLANGIAMQLNLQNQFQRFLGLDERELAPILKASLRSAKSAIDVGANDGYYTLIFLRSNVDVVTACEPSAVVEQLVENARLNGFFANERLRIEKRMIGHGINDVSLRELLEPLPRPTLVKMDIDGGEVIALESADGARDLDRITWIIETHSRELEQDCVAWLEGHGFAAKIIKPAWWRAVVPEQRPLKHNQWLFAKAATLDSECR